MDAALSHLLVLRDNNLPDCEHLLAQMLERRDQWIRAFPLTGDMPDTEWDAARSRLEQPFREEVKRVHGEAHRLLTKEPVLANELVFLARYACDNGNAKIASLSGLRELPSPEVAAVEHWRCIARFLLTDGGEWRKRVDARDGFPPKDGGQKSRMIKLLMQLAQIDGLREALRAALELPEPRYEERQWETLRHCFMALRLAVAELRVLFAERNTVDFTELSLAARDVLGNPDASADVLLALSGNIRHLLVDEFQDTSRSQHELLGLLVRAWEQDDGRTCFFVGDPMQSVYLFRQAEVELFGQVARDGLISDGHTVEFEQLELTTNFRSHAGLTTRWNTMFDAVFADGEIRYSKSVAAEAALPGEGVHVHPQIVGAAGGKPTAEEKELAREGEAEQTLAVIAEHLELIKKAEADKKSEYRVAVLARSRGHLAKIVALLRKREIPFRAVELEKLNERQELLDLMSLTRALLHPMDRVAWLSVLRAPWCGLTLNDLHALTGADDRAFRNTPALELIEQRMDLLSADGAARLRRTAAILRQALAVRFQGIFAASFSQWIERTWRSLGGAQCVDATAYENAQVFFTLLDAVTPDGMACLTEDFEEEMKRMFAQPDPGVSERSGVQLMTIHKAKGLGFDVVIVPGLDRGVGQDRQQLILSLERTNALTGGNEMLVAPIGGRGEDSHPTYKWVRTQITRRADEEIKRLLYVACTRARLSLHLMGTAKVTAAGLKALGAKSLLATAWPAVQADFAAAQESQTENVIAFPTPRDEGATLELAAGADPEARARILLRRLPVDADLRPRGTDVTFTAAADGVGAGFARPEGSRDARQKGSVVHALLEMASRGVSPQELAVPARTLLRAAAYSGKALEDAVEEVLAAVKSCVTDPDGAWILAPHAQAQSEASWTGWKGDALETLRADRVFVAGAAPRAAGEDHLWIVDYKMSAPAGDPDFLEHQRETYAPQLARYARALSEAQGISLPVRFGLYYPRIARLDWWGA